MVITRYRLTPTFGRDTIRRFNNNISLMKQLAAHDYEDILQCAIPAFDGLLPEEDNEIVLDLLFLMATFHVYAKLRLHTESTVQSFELVTTALCQALRRFRDVTCARYQTRELPQETAARARREAAEAHREAAGPSLSHSRHAVTVSGPCFHVSIFCFAS
ncbi:hypothetical protein BJV78DRAFT_1138891 [Lactifluus subvellereus]|nr:hypothetical protein BJV78DRAFT_1138891 [Lactifluus subvellereus]